MTRFIDQRVDEPRDLADARLRHRWNVSEWYSIAHDALFSHDEDGVAAFAPDSSLGDAGAPDPACRSEERTIGPGDAVGPAAFDAGAPDPACRSGYAPAAGLEAERRWGPSP